MIINPNITKLTPQAGSRYEMTNEMGCSHFIRACSDAHGKGYTSLAKSRVLQQFGGYITCTSDRQNIMFTLQCAPPDFPALKHLLLDAAVRLVCLGFWVA